MSFKSGTAGGDKSVHVDRNHVSALAEQLAVADNFIGKFTYDDSIKSGVIVPAVTGNDKFPGLLSKA